MNSMQMSLPFTDTIQSFHGAGIPFCVHREGCLRRPRVAGGWPLPGHMTDDDCEAWPFCLKKTSGEDGPASPIKEKECQ